jgi:imidazolonepropionase-like amidohydrolase
MQKIKFLVLCILFTVAFASVFAQSTYPVNDVANPKDEHYAFTNATIVKDVTTTLQNATMVIRQGKIEAVGVGITIPKEAVVVDCKGKFIYPSFIDMYSDYGTAPVARPAFSFGGQSQMLSNTKGAYGWNQAIKSEIDIAKTFAVNDAKAKELRSNGFGIVLTHQMDGLSRGTGAIVSLANEKENKVMLKDRGAAFYSFDKGSSTQEYPNSLMGFIATLRQNFLDAQWYKTAPSSEGTNLSLKAFNDNVSLPQIFEANDKWNVLRADKVGDEFGVQYIIKAGGNEYQRMTEMKGTNASFILPLNFPQGMDVEDPTDARYISLADLKHWDMAAGNLAAFEKNNINFSITSFGLRENNSFFANLKKAIQAGLTEQKALEALTKTPATLLGIADKAGSLEVGKLANFLITSGNIFGDKTTIYQNWVQGNRYILKEDGWRDVRGTYNFVLNNQPYKLEVKGDAAKPTASLLGNDTTKVDFNIIDKLVKLNFSLKKDASATTNLTGVAIDNNWSGTGVLADGKWTNWSATKIAELPADTSKKKKADVASKKASELTYPNGGYGFTTLPIQENILIKNATVWTNEKEGKLENTDVIIKAGKITAIGKNLSDANAKIIDGTGKHLSAGIIDEHSHIAGTGSINECSQSVTAEVRIADIINPDDVDIYRQLSGGVTGSHILHGSCNTIGGQTQLLKLRWGVNAEQMKLANWDGFIKFALGENVKRSFSQNSNRYPDTRMGVEQVLLDAFTRAKDYEKLPVGKRKDLELETLLEIINKKRFITCHSYVQSEIVGMMRVAEKFGFKVNTFTHILEGYKVADKMKTHGAAASTFSDWWAYKMEVIDAIPYNATIMNKIGLTVAINSDDAEMARRLNQEAAKSIKYGGMSEEDALKMVTLNPAIMLHVADRTGSIKIGKDADLVLWSDNPLSIYAKAEKTIVDGIVYFDKDRDVQLRAAIAKERNELLQKMVSAKKGGEKMGPAIPSFNEHNFCEEDHDAGKTIWHRIESRMIATNTK